MEQSPKNLFIICLILLSVIFVLLAIVFSGNQVNIPKDVLFVILLGMAASLFTWVLIYSLTSKNMNSELSKNFHLLHHKLDNMDHVLEHKKNGLLERDFYRNLYDGAVEIRISGIVGKDLFGYLLKTTNGHRPKNHWLANFSKNPVTLQILMLHPDSSQATLYDEIEKGSNNKHPVTNAINKSIDQLKDFSLQKGKNHLHKNSKILVRFTKKPLYSIISHTVYRDGNRPSILLMGPLFAHNRSSSMYNIPEGLSIYNDCLKDFNKNFNDATPIFEWEGRKKYFAPLQ